MLWDLFLVISYLDHVLKENNMLYDTYVFHKSWNGLRTESILNAPFD